MKKLISFLLVFVLVLSLLSFSAFAVSGDSSGNLFDFPYIGYLYQVRTSGPSDGYIRSGIYISNANVSLTRATIFLPYDLVSGSIISDPVFESYYSSSGFSDSFLSLLGWLISAYDSSGIQLGSKVIDSSLPWSVPSGTRFLVLTFRCSMSSSVSTSFYASFSGMQYSDFVYDYGTASSSDIMSGLTAIAQSLLDLETGPYSGVSGVSVDSNGDLQHTVVNNATLENLLNAVGIATTDSNFVLRGMYNNFGSFFTYYDINDSTSGTVITVHGLPQYISSLGSELTDGINRLQRDNDILYSSIQSVSSSQSALNTTLQDALYEETDSSPSENWSVAKWLKGIYDSITGFFTNFWSPAETDLKSVAEPGMQAAADNNLVASSSDVDSMSDIGGAFSSFASFPTVDPIEAVNILSDSDYYRFWTQETEDDLLRHDPAQLRGSKSSASEVEYVDVLSDHLKELRSILGVVSDGK